MKNPFAVSAIASTPTAQIDLDPPAGVPESPPIIQPGPSKTSDPIRVLKRWQLESGRTRKRLEDFESQLEAARDTHREVERRLGERLVEGEPPDEVEAEVRQAMERVHSMEQAVKVATERMDTAERELRNAETEAKRAASREEQAQLLTTAKQIDQWMESGKPLFEKYAEQQKSLLDRGDEAITLRLHQASLSFKTYLFRVCPKMAGCSTGYEPFQNDPKWAAPWSSHHPGQDIVELNE